MSVVQYIHPPAHFQWPKWSGICFLHGFHLVFEETQFMGICLDPLKGKITANEYKLEFVSTKKHFNADENGFFQSNNGQAEGVGVGSHRKASCGWKWCESYAVVFNPI